MSRVAIRATDLLRTAVKVAAVPFGVGSRRRPGDVVVLLYHRVGSGSREIDLPPATFDAQLWELSARQPVRSLDEALSSPDGGVVVTFDDGFRDFHDTVLPRLCELGIPVVLYLATGLVSDGDGRSNGADRGMTWNELREAVATGLVTVGSHTHSHVPLVRVTEQEVDDELRRSKEAIEDRLGVACRHFAYPFAVASPAADRVARRLFDSVASDAWRTNRRGRIDRHRLGRTPVLRNDAGVWFRAKAEGRLDAEGWAYRAVRRGPWRPL
jgi:peptidoglycan/xylan/chitin deacetylase (PgdA/CDA1 family)